MTAAPDLVALAMTQRDLRQWNSLPASGHIRAGQRLRVAPPGKSKAGERAPAGEAARTHLVRRGDTLTGLAKRYGVSVRAIRAANGMSEGAMLRTGVALRIPG